MKRTLPLLALLLPLSFPLHATLVAGRESMVTSPTLDVAGFDQSHARIATDGNAFFAVWKDGTQEVHGTAISATGERLFDTPLRIATGATMDDAPAIDAGGGGYLVAWSKLEAETATARMQARMVFANGPMSATLELGESDQRARPRVAFNGTNFLVMWLAPELRLRGAVIRFNGELVRTFDITTAELTYPDIPLVSSGNTFYFAIGRIDINAPGTGEGNLAAVHLVSVDENGNAGTPVVLSPAFTPVFNLRAEERGGNIAMAWSTAIFNPGSISSVRVTSAGPSPVDTFEAGTLRLHGMVADSSGFLLIYGNETERRARYAGSSAETTLPVPLPPMTIYDAASNGTRMLLLARALPRPGSGAPLANDLYLQQLDDPALEPLSVAPRHQASPGIAAAGDLRLAVWSEHFGAQRRITFMAARIDGSGQVLDPNGIDLGMQMNMVITPYVASNGTGWLIVWWESGKVYGMRVARDGARLDATPFVIAEDAWGEPGRGHAGVSWDGQQYVVVFVRGVFFRGLRSRIFATHVLPNGNVQGPETPLVDTGAYDAPAIATDPVTGQSLVIWRGSLKTGAALLSRGGAFAPIALPSEFPTIFRATVAWNAGTFLVASAYTGPFGSQVRWHLVSPTGVVQTPLSHWPALRPPIGGWATLDLEPFEEGFLLYTADVSGSSTDFTTELTAARISPQGLLAEGPHVIAETVPAFQVPLDAAGSTVVYIRTIGHPVRELERLFVRTVTNVPPAKKRRAVR